VFERLFISTSFILTSVVLVKLCDHYIRPYSGPRPATDKKPETTQQQFVAKLARELVSILQ
jgi:hypothetical protein